MILQLKAENGLPPGIHPSSCSDGEEVTDAIREHPP